MVDFVQQQQPGQNMFNPSIQQTGLDRYGSAIKDLTDPSYILPSVEMDLRRQRKILNPETGKIEVQRVGDPLMSEEGITNCLSLCRSAINNIAVLNSLKDQMIEQTMLRIADDLILDLMLSMAQYEIKHSKERDLILNIVLIPIWLTLLRGREGGERKFWGANPGYNEPQANKTSWNPFRRGG